MQYNCRRPFTLIKYSVESKSGLNIDLFHVQNVNPYFNFGFELNYFNGEGHYLKTQHAGKMLRGFSSYTGARHRAFLSTSFNQFRTQENGGISSSAYITDSLKVKPAEYPVNLLSSESVTDYQDISILQEWNLLKEFSPLDSLLGDIETFKLFVGHQFLYEYSARRYRDDENDTVFYKQFNNYDSISTRDYAVQRLLSQEGFLGFNKRISKQVGIGGRIGAGYEFSEYRFRNIDFTNPQQYYNSTFYALHFSGKFWGDFRWELNNKQYIEGQKAGDSYLNATAVKEVTIFKDTTVCTAYIENTIAEPNLYHQHYESNNFYWKNNFSKTSTQSIKLSVSDLKNKYSLSAYYGIFSEYIFMNSSALPEQLSDPFTALCIEGSHTVHLGAFSMKNALTWQKASSQKGLAVPQIVSENSLFVTMKTFEKKLTITTGIDASFFTEYTIPSYMPATGAFYSESEAHSSIYPVADIFLNLKLKRMRVMIKYSQISQVAENLGGPGEQFFKGIPSTVNSYPFGKPRFSFGLAWHFFN